jgi:hypothetical protein
VAVSLLEVFKGPTAALLAAVFLSIVVGVFGNFRYLFIFLRGSSLYVSYS